MMVDHIFEALDDTYPYTMVEKDVASETMAIWFFATEGNKTFSVRMMRPEKMEVFEARTGVELKVSECNPTTLRVKETDVPPSNIVKFYATVVKIVQEIIDANPYASKKRAYMMAIPAAYMQRLQRFAVRVAQRKLRSSIGDLYFEQAPRTTGRNNGYYCMFMARRGFDMSKIIKPDVTAAVDNFQINLTPVSGVVNTATPAAAATATPTPSKAVDKKSIAQTFAECFVAPAIAYNYSAHASGIIGSEKSTRLDKVTSAENGVVMLSIKAFVDAYQISPDTVSPLTKMIYIMKNPSLFADLDKTIAAFKCLGSVVDQVPGLSLIMNGKVKEGMAEIASKATTQTFKVIYQQYLDRVDVVDRVNISFTILMAGLVSANTNLSGSSDPVQTILDVITRKFGVDPQSTSANYCIVDSSGNPISTTGFATQCRAWMDTDKFVSMACALYKISKTNNTFTQQAIAYYEELMNPTSNESYSMMMSFINLIKQNKLSRQLCNDLFKACRHINSLVTIRIVPKPLLTAAGIRVFVDDMSTYFNPNDFAVDFFYNGSIEFMKLWFEMRYSENTWMSSADKSKIYAHYVATLKNMYDKDKFSISEFLPFLSAADAASMPLVMGDEYQDVLKLTSSDFANAVYKKTIKPTKADACLILGGIIKSYSMYETVRKFVDESYYFSLTLEALSPAVANLREHDAIAALKQIAQTTGSVPLAIEADSMRTDTKVYLTPANADAEYAVELIDTLNKLQVKYNVYQSKGMWQHGGGADYRLWTFISDIKRILNGESPEFDMNTYDRFNIYGNSPVSIIAEMDPLPFKADRVFNVLIWSGYYTTEALKFIEDYLASLDDSSETIQFIDKEIASSGDVDSVILRNCVRTTTNLKDLCDARQRDISLAFIDIRKLKDQPVDAIVQYLIQNTSYRASNVNKLPDAIVNKLKDADVKLTGSILKYRSREVINTVKLLRSSGLDGFVDKFVAAMFDTVDLNDQGKILYALHEHAWGTNENRDPSITQGMDNLAKKAIANLHNLKAIPGGWRNNKELYIALSNRIDYKDDASEVELLCNDIAEKFSGEYVRSLMLAPIVSTTYAKELNQGEIKPLVSLTPDRIRDIMRFNNITMVEGATSVRKLKSETYGQMVLRAVDELDANNKVLPEQRLTKIDKTEDALEIDSINLNKTRNGKHGTTHIRILESFDVDLTFPEYAAYAAAHPNRTVHKKMYHGTSPTAAAMIIRCGFTIIPSSDPSCVGRMLGDGVYFSNVIDKVQQYIGEQGWSRKPGTIGYVFEMEAQYDQRHPRNRLYARDSQYDWAAAGISGTDGIQSPEWAVLNPKAQVKIYRAHKVVLVSEDHINRLKQKHSAITEQSGLRKYLSTTITEAATKTICITFGDGYVPTAPGTDEVFDKLALKPGMAWDYSMVGPCLVYNNTLGFEGNYVIPSTSNLRQDDPEHLLQMIYQMFS